MPVESANDLATFFDVSEFAETVVWRTSAGDVALPAIFDAEHLALASDASVAISTAMPQMTCREVDLPSAAVQGDVVVVRGRQYEVRDISTDGTGVVTVILEDA